MAVEHPLEHVLEVGVRLDAVELCRGDERVHERRAIQPQPERPEFLRPTRFSGKTARSTSTSASARGKMSAFEFPQRQRTDGHDKAAGMPYSGACSMELPAVRTVRLQPGEVE